MVWVARGKKGAVARVGFGLTDFEGGADGKMMSRWAL